MNSKYVPASIYGVPDKEHSRFFKRNHVYYRNRHIYLELTTDGNLWQVSYQLNRRYHRHYAYGMTSGPLYYLEHRGYIEILPKWLQVDKEF